VCVCVCVCACISGFKLGNRYQREKYTSVTNSKEKFMFCHSDY